MAQKTDYYKIYGIGKNHHCELGLTKEKESTTHLSVVMARLNIDGKAQIHSGNKFSFYCINGHNYFAAGDNEYGQCGLENHYPMTKLESLDHFDKKKIEIKTVCTNVTSTKTFWITKNNMIYGHGQNEQLCLFNDQFYDIAPPQLIANIGSKKPYQVITDIKSSRWCTIALSNTDDMIIMVTNNWSRDVSVGSYYYVPEDIMELIKVFTHRNHVWWTKNGYSWKEVEFFRDNSIAIDQISMGLWHVLFLGNNGDVWVHGKFNTEAQCGIIEKKVCCFRHNPSTTVDLKALSFDCLEQKSYYFRKPAATSNNGQMPTKRIEKISWFSDQNIRIIKIESGAYHNLLLDDLGHVYSFGGNGFGQCGVKPDTDRVVTPFVIESLLDCKIEDIGCGYSHSFVKSVLNEFYLFGFNGSNQCITYDERDRVKTPFCINENVMAITSCRCIKGVYLGNCNTKVIVVVSN